MAIAFYVPPEYGPPQNQQQQQEQRQAAQQNNNDPQIIDITQHHFHQDTNNNNTRRRIQQEPPQDSETWNSQIVSLVTGLVTELLAVFGNRVNNSSGGNQRNTSQELLLRMRRPAAQRLPNINILPEPVESAATPNLPDVIPSPFRYLPDLVSCHAGISLRYNSSSSPRQQHRLQSSSSSRERPPVVPLSPGSSQNFLPPSQTTVDFKVSLKLGISLGKRGESSGHQEERLQSQVPALYPEEVYRDVGAQLRAVADSFQNTRARWGRSQLTSSPHHHQSY